MRPIWLTNDYQKWGAGIETVPLQEGKIGRIPKEFATEAYKEYAAQFGSEQTFERLHERGGFGEYELIHLLYHRIKRLEEGQKP